MRTFYKIRMNTRIILLGVGLILSPLVVKHLLTTHNPKYILAENIKKINQDCPQALNNTFRYDSASIVYDSVMCYNMTMVDVNKDEINPKIFKQIDPQIKSIALTNSKFKRLRKYKIPIMYRYYDSNGIMFHEIFIPSSLYNQDKPVTKPFYSASGLLFIR